MPRLQNYSIIFHLKNIEISQLSEGPITSATVGPINQNKDYNISRSNMDNKYFELPTNTSYL